MTPERWRQVEDLFHAARERAPQEREAFVERASVDEEVRREVRGLLNQREGTLLADGLTGALAALAAPPDRSGAALGSYQLGARIGVGAMGDVYRARDTRLGRDVAVKILPEALGRDSDRVARFEREARILATLNHPNIAALYGIVEDAAVRGLVLELVEGPTLADLLVARSKPAHGSVSSPGLPLADALSIARQIARGLEAAHERGVVHRDLKPANVAVTPAGVVKVLDFGLAKIAVVESSGPGGIPVLETRDGLVLGTVAYMSPEQARGLPVDKRSDIWAFGCVLYEMLSGSRPFQGENSADVLAAIVGADPDWSLLPADTPTQVRSVLRRCLTRDPERRTHDIADARLDLEDAHEPDASALATGPANRRPLRRLMTIGLTTTVAALAGGAAVAWWLAAPRPGPVLRAAIDLEESIVTGEGSVVLTPDGRSVVYQARGRDNVQRLYRRPLDGVSSMPIAGTDGGHAPFFSPDGQWVGFASNLELRKVPISGGVPTTICRIQSHFGASWGDDGTIVVALAPETGLHRCPADGGTAEPLLSLAPEDAGNDHRYPNALPGGRGVIYAVATGPANDARIVVFDARSGARRDLLHGAASARLIARDRLAYAINGDLFAVGFDLDRLELVGEPVRLASGVQEDTDGAPEYGFSTAGDLVFVAGRSGGPRNTMARVDMDGRATPLDIPAAPLGFPRISPDGRTLAYTVSGAKPSVWLFDFDRAVSSRATFGRFSYPIWTPDGQLTMVEGGQGAQRIVMPSGDGSAALETLSGSNREQAPEDWTPDGRTLFYRIRQPSWRLWAYSRDDGRAEPITLSNIYTHSARVAPNGRWMVYHARESQPPQVYVRSTISGTGRQQVSRDGAMLGVWAPDGRRIYYRGLSGTPGDGLWAVEVTEQSSQLRIGAPRLLFRADEFAEAFDITRDGRHFVMVRQEATPVTRQIQVVLNPFGQADTR